MQKSVQVFQKVIRSIWLSMKLKPNQNFNNLSFFLYLITKSIHQMFHIFPSLLSYPVIFIQFSVFHSLPEATMMKNVLLLEILSEMRCTSSQFHLIIHFSSSYHFQQKCIRGIREQQKKKILFRTATLKGNCFGDKFYRAMWVCGSVFPHCITPSIPAKTQLYYLKT